MPSEVKHLLSLLRVGLRFFPFKLAWKTATLLALVTAEHCFDLTLIFNDSQHFFLQHHAAIFVLASGGKMD